MCEVIFELYCHNHNLKYFVQNQLSKLASFIIFNIGDNASIISQLGQQYINDYYANKFTASNSIQIIILYLVYE